MGASREADVVVVGAGFAGLAAARAVVAAGSEAVVLEARDRVGGRVVNAEIGDGKVVEMGGQWVGPTQERIAALAARPRRRDLPHPQRRRQPPPRRRPAASLLGDDPAPQPAGAARRPPGDAAAEQARSADRPRSALGIARRRRARRDQRRRLDRADDAKRHGAPAHTRRRTDDLGRRAGGALAASPRLLSALGGQLRAAHRRRGRGPAGSVRGRLAARRDPRRRGARRPRRPRRARAPDRARPRWRHRGGRRAAAASAAGDRRDTAAAGRQGSSSSRASLPPAASSRSECPRAGW